MKILSSSLVPTSFYAVARSKVISRPYYDVARHFFAVCQFQLTSAFSSSNRCTKNIDLIRVQAPDSMGIRIRCGGSAHPIDNNGIGECSIGELLLR